MTQNIPPLPWLDDDDLYDDDPFEPRTPVTLTAAQQVDLVTALRRILRTDGCDNTLRGARRWAEGSDAPWPRLGRELEANGGFCDCEVLFNVFPGVERECGESDGADAGTAR